MHTHSYQIVNFEGTKLFSNYSLVPVALLSGAVI
jgi:hypothetical protein